MLKKLNILFVCRQLGASTNFMVKKIEKGKEVLYQCEECGFHYKSEQLAKQCEDWCRAHHSCNLEIIKDAVENKTQKMST